MSESVGKIVAISNLRVDVLLSNNQITYKTILVCHNADKEYKFEVAKIDGSYAIAIPFDDVKGLKRGLDVYKEEGTGLSVPYNDEIIGKIFSSYGKPIDKVFLKDRINFGDIVTLEQLERDIFVCECANGTIR